MKVFGLLLALLVAAVGAFLLLFDVDQFRPAIQAQLQTSLERKVSLGPIRLGLFPPALRVQDVVIGENPPLVSTRELSVRAELLPLLRKQVRISSLRLAEPAIELVQSADGHWNYETPGGGSQTKTPLSIGELAVENGRVAITSKDKPREVYDHIDLSLRDFAPGRTFTAELGVELPQALKLEAELKARDDADAYLVESLTAKAGGTTLTGAGTLSSKATDFTIKIQRSDIAGLARTAAAFGVAFSSSMNVTGDLSADVKLSGPADRLSYNGSVVVDELEVTGQGWSQPVRIPQAKIEYTPEAIRTNTFTMESGVTRLTASAVVHGYASEAGDFEAKLSAPSAKLEELLHMAAIYGGAALEGVSATGNAALDVAVRGRLASERNPDPPVSYAGSGSLTNATVQIPSLKKPVRIAETRLRFSDDQIAVDKTALAFGSSHATGTLSLRGFARPEMKFDASIDKIDVAELQASVVPSKSPGRKQPLQLRGSGRLSIGQIVGDGLSLRNVNATCDVRNGVITLDPLTAEMFGGRHNGVVTIDTRPENTAYALKAKIERVDANQLLSSTTSIKEKIFGLMAANGDLKFAPKPGENIARSLNGTLAVQLTRGKLAGINVVNQLAGVAKLLGFRQQGEAVTNILGLTGNLQFTNGLARTDDLKMTFDGGSLTAAGAVNLVDQSLDLKTMAVMSRGFSDQFTGNSIGGLLTSVLKNKDGELVIPAIVSGTLAAPRFTPDAAEIARLRVSGIAGGGLSGAIDAATKGDGARGILGAITGRKQSQSEGKQDAQKGEPETKQPPKDPAQSILDLFKKRKDSQ